MKPKPVPMDEMKLAVEIEDPKAFRVAFLEKFGSRYDPMRVVTTMYNRHTNRGLYKTRIEIAELKARTVLVPAIIKHKNTEAPILSGVRSHHDDDDEVTMLKKQHGLLAEILQLSKERLKVEQEMRDIAKAQFEFFGGLKKKVGGE